MRLSVATCMPLVPSLRYARTPLVVLAAAVVFVVGTALAIIALTISDSRAVSDVGSSPAERGGETVVAKFAQTNSPARPRTDKAEPATPSRLLAMALAPMITAAPERKKEPTLKGLSEIPRELIWNRAPEEIEKDERPKAFGVLSKVSEVLPWDAVEPVPFSPLPAATPAKGRRSGTAAVPREPLKLPDGGQVEAWVKAKVTEIKGAERTRPLYHFQVWLEPPAELKRRLVGVAYDFSSPAVRPQSQASSDQATGFRVSAGGLACADEITVTLRFDDGQSRKVAIDGCKLLS